MARSSDTTAKYNELAQLILAVVATIPAGKVASYGQVAALAGLPKHARLVGRVLGNLAADSDMPWHRVINAQGKISVQHCDIYGQNIQAQKLCAEDVIVQNNRVNLARYQMG
ncbi:MGMT family protein [Acinetobacter larvae]|uniref:Methyltransferase n=1 Tax=Acinetobacter larvae TaxID=1789224 RepID=A0A1B2LXS0_9GAMM|nr:MGMT family protein [Acinetobacter larvae]AOA57725.1 methyltransferase [Acinetobacter larvae]